MGRCWGPFGLSLGPLGPSWGPFGGPLGPSWGGIEGLLCKPICEVACCSATIWLEGPLEPPFGRTLILDCTLQRACLQPIIHHSEYPYHWRASAFWNVCCSTSFGQDRHTWPVIAGGGKYHHLRFTDPRTYSTRPNTLSEELCAFSYAKEVVNITDEPALVAEPGWLLFSRLTR